MCLTTLFCVRNVTGHYKNVTDLLGRFQNQQYQLTEHFTVSFIITHYLLFNSTDTNYIEQSSPTEPQGDLRTVYNSSDIMGTICIMLMNIFSQTRPLQPNHHVLQLTNRNYINTGRRGQGSVTLSTQGMALSNFRSSYFKNLGLICSIMLTIANTPLNKTTNYNYYLTHCSRFILLNYEYRASYTNHNFIT